MKIRVATLNVWALPEPIAKSVIPRMQAIGARIADPTLDIVAFQEVWLPAARESLIESGQRHGYAHVWHTGDTLGGGMLVLSRLPILEGYFEPYSLSGYPELIENGEYLSGKGFVKLRVQGSEGNFALIATHLHARYKKDFRHAFRSHRTGQIIQLAEHARKETDPLVLVGDFNVSENQPEYRVLTGLTGLRDAGVELDRRIPTVFRGNPYRIRGIKPDRRIDYIFARNGGRHSIAPVDVEAIFDEPLEIGGRTGTYSNHSGVVADLEISDNRQTSVFAINRRAIELATEMLAQGRAEAESRRMDDRASSGIGVALAALATIGSSKLDMTRRRFLGSALRVGGAAALAQGVGYSMISEYLLPGELSAFDEAEARLQQLAKSAPPTDRDSLPT